MKSQDISASDLPVEDPKDDSLGYAPFAEELGKAILKSKSPEGLVFAINGQWGSGKSSVINFIKFYLKKSPEGSELILINFNPWHFSGQEDLAKEFFNEILVRFDDSQIRNDQLKKDLSSIAEIVSKIPHPWVKIGGLLIGKVLTRRSSSLNDLREKVSDALRNWNRRIIIVIDDIDRLTGEEVRQIFRLIKSVANFPNIIYLLAYDQEVVAHALAKDQDGISGTAYLEKIVQMPFHLPAPDRISLRQMLFAGLTKIISNTPEGYFDSTRWQKIYNGFIDSCIETPRSIVRLLNSIGVIYPSLESEVNVVDYFALEALRIFYPSVYETIRANEWYFTLSDSDIGISMRIDEAGVKRFHEKWMEAVEQSSRDAVNKCVFSLFPKVGRLFSPQIVENEKNLRASLRICVPALFNTYFRLTVPSGTIRNNQFQFFLKQIEDEEWASSELIRLIEKKAQDGTSTAKEYLERLADHVNVVPKNSITALVKVLFVVGDRLSNERDEGKRFFAVGNNMRLLWILWPSLKRLEPKERLQSLQDCFSNTQSIYMITFLYETLMEEHDEEKNSRSSINEEPLLEAAQVADLKTIVLDKINQAFKDHSILNAPNIGFILSFWKKQNPQANIDDFLEGIFASDGNFMKFMEGFVTYTRSAGEGAVEAKVTLRVKPSWFQPFIEPSKVFERIGSVNLSVVNDFQKQVLEQYKKEYTRYTKNGGVEDAHRYSDD